jgi:hypothetical protein
MCIRPQPTADRQWLKLVPKSSTMPLAVNPRHTEPISHATRGPSNRPEVFLLRSARPHAAPSRLHQLVEHLSRECPGPRAGAGLPRPVQPAGAHLRPGPCACASVRAHTQQEELMRTCISARTHSKRSLCARASVRAHTARGAYAHVRTHTQQEELMRTCTAGAARARARAQAHVHAACASVRRPAATRVSPSPSVCVGGASDRSDGEGDK